MTVATELAASTAGLPEIWIPFDDVSGDQDNGGSATTDLANITPDATTSMTFRADTNADGNPAGVTLDGTGTAEEFSDNVANASTYFTAKGSMIILVKYVGVGATAGSRYFWCISDSTTDNDVVSLGIGSTAIDAPTFLVSMQDDTTSLDYYTCSFADLATAGISLMDGNWHTLGYSVGSGPTATDGVTCVDGIEVTNTYTTTNTVDNDWWPDEAGWGSAKKVVAGNRPIAGSNQPEDWTIMDGIIYANQQLTAAQHLEIHQIINPNAGTIFASKTIRRQGRRLFSANI